MSFDVLSDLNWLAVIVATLVYFAIGGLWYSPILFGKAWQRASGMEMPEGQRPGAAIYVVPLISAFLATVATAMLAAATGSSDLGDGLVLGIVVAVGYAGALTLLGSTFDRWPEPRVRFGINFGYHLLGLIAAAVIVSVWD